ncbi:PaaI family thioesterase [Chloroflexota bacterium]
MVENNMPPAGKKEINKYIAELKKRAETEPVLKFFGMLLEDISPGFARVSMQVKPEYVNFHGVIFGGVIMALADQAFGYGANSVALPSYAAQFNTNIIAGAAVGDVLAAECTVLRSGRRAGFSEIRVTDQAGKLIAVATGVAIPMPKA